MSCIDFRLYNPNNNCIVIYTIYIKQHLQLVYWIKLVMSQFLIWSILIPNFPWVYCKAVNSIPGMAIIYHKLYCTHFQAVFFNNKSVLNAVKFDFIEWRQKKFPIFVIQYVGGRLNNYQNHWLKISNYCCQIGHF